MARHTGNYRFCRLGEDFRRRSKDYWLKTRNDTSIPRHWTEGVKKAGAGLSIALAVIALTGVWNWGKDGQLAKEVSDWAQPGTIHYIGLAE
ncbi:DUF3854 domain-containing protein [Microcoleus sp. CAWBG556]|uniref:DUF3854 domain-containing protein n=1 Tax=unclassified Microcoleus TaxID=2642155 RepID=UPI0025FDC039|nr:DUF3854 domain-containing protein [Microcoleus sp. CAWBG556]